jgi:hypothetical protein
VRLLPITRDPTLGQQPLQGRIERSFFNLEHIARDLPQPLRDPIAMHGFQRQCLQQHHVECSGEQRFRFHTWADYPRFPTGRKQFVTNDTSVNLRGFDSMRHSAVSQFQSGALEAASFRLKWLDTDPAAFSVKRSRSVDKLE